MRLFKKKTQQNQTEIHYTQNSSTKEELSLFQKRLKQLNAPYKKVNNPFDNQQLEEDKVSVFWDANAGYTPEYKSIPDNMEKINNK